MASSLFIKVKTWTTGLHQIHSFWEFTTAGGALPRSTSPLFLLIWPNPVFSGITKLFLVSIRIVKCSWDLERQALWCLPLRKNISYCWARFPGSSIKRMNWLIPAFRFYLKWNLTYFFRYLALLDEVPMNRSNGGFQVERLAWWLRWLANHNQRKFAAELAFSWEVKFALGECWPIDLKEGGRRHSF